MPTIISNPSAVILTADDHYWPNLQGLLHWSGQLRHVFVCHTDAGRDAARRLQAFCEDFLRRQQPELQVHGLDHPVAAPQDVRRQVFGWQSEFPGEQWLLLAGSESSLVLAGMIPFVGQAGVTLVCRAGDRWLQLLPDEVSGVRAEPAIVPAEATDIVPVETLLRHFWHGRYVTRDSGPTADVMELSRKSLQHRGDWDRVARDAGYPDLGLPFEWFLGQALRELGAGNLAIVSIQRTLETPDEPETMLVVNRGGLRIVDGSLNRLDGLATILSHRAQGLEARGLLLWPTRAFPDEFRGLLTAHHLDLLEHKDLRRFFHRLAEFVGGDALPPSLVEAEKLLGDVADRGLRFFPSRRPREQAKPARPAPKGRLTRARPQFSPATTPGAHQATPAPRPALPVEPREAAFDQPVRVKILGPFNLGNLRGYDVQEEGWPVGVLAWGTPPGQKPRLGELLTVYRENLDPKNPRYRWDLKP